MKTIQKLAIALIMILAIANIKGQGIIINSDTIKNTNWTLNPPIDTIEYCKSNPITISWWGYDSLYIKDNGFIVHGGAFNTIYNVHHTYVWDSASNYDSIVTGLYHSGILSQNIAIRFISKQLKSHLCWVTVDTSSTHNLIIWDTTGTSNEDIDSLRLYFLNASNVWQKIAEESYSDTTRYFVDNINNPNVNTVRYMILGINSCSGLEDTANSPWHNTLFINSNGTGTFSWSGTGYLIDGNSLPVLTYYLYRNDTIIDSISGTQNKMTDINYNSNATYWIGAKLNIDMCPLDPIAMAHRPTLNNTALLSHSNILNRKSLGIPGIVGKGETSLYPNPSNGNFTINSGMDNSVLKVYNTLGEIVYSSTIGRSVNISLNEPNGIYLYRIVGESENLISEGKLIIQK